MVLCFLFFCKLVWSVYLALNYWLKIFITLFTSYIVLVSLFLKDQNYYDWQVLWYWPFLHYRLLQSLNCFFETRFQIDQIHMTGEQPINYCKLWLRPYLPCLTIYHCSVVAVLPVPGLVYEHVSPRSLQQLLLCCPFTGHCHGFQDTTDHSLLSYTQRQTGKKCTGLNKCELVLR